MANFENEINRFDYSYPGIYSVSCDVDGYTIFRESENVYDSLVDVQLKLEKGIFEDPILQQNFQNYSIESFRFTPITIGWEFSNPEVRHLKLHQVIAEHYRLHNEPN